MRRKGLKRWEGKELNRESKGLNRWGREGKGTEGKEVNRWGMEESKYKGREGMGETDVCLNKLYDFEKLVNSITSRKVAT